MKRTIIIVLVLLFPLPPAAAQDEGVSEEINPSEYVPLAVGNSWTYEHFYFLIRVNTPPLAA